MKKKYVYRWCLRGVDVADETAMQLCLNEGYEPMTVVSQFIPEAPEKPTLLIPNQHGQISIKTVQVMYFKRKDKVEVKQEITIFKRKTGEVENVTEPTPAA